MSETITLHVHNAILYFSLSSLHDFDVKMPTCTFYGGRKQTTTNFSFSFYTWMRFPRNQLLENSPTFDIFSDLAWRRLPKRELILKETFSLPSPSSMLKLHFESRNRKLSATDHVINLTDGINNGCVGQWITRCPYTSKVSGSTPAGWDFFLFFVVVLFCFVSFFFSDIGSVLQHQFIRK